MAPRGGGGKSGGSHSSDDSGDIGSSSGGSSGSSAPTNWGSDILLGGSHFKVPVAVAALAIACLCLVGMLVVAIWLYTVQSKGRRIFKWFGMPLATGAVIMCVLFLLSMVLTGVLTAFLLATWV